MQVLSRSLYLEMPRLPVETPVIVIFGDVSKHFSTMTLLHPLFSPGQVGLETTQTPVHYCLTG